MSCRFWTLHGRFPNTFEKEIGNFENSIEVFDDLLLKCATNRAMHMELSVSWKVFAWRPVKKRNWFWKTTKINYFFSKVCCFGTPPVSTQRVRVCWWTCSVQDKSVRGYYVALLKLARRMLNSIHSPRPVECMVHGATARACGIGLSCGLRYSGTMVVHAPALSYCVRQCTCCIHSGGIGATTCHWGCVWPPLCCVLYLRALWMRVLVCLRLPFNCCSWRNPLICPSFVLTCPILHCPTILHPESQWPKYWLIIRLETLSAVDAHRTARTRAGMLSWSFTWASFYLHFELNSSAVNCFWEALAGKLMKVS